MCDALMEILEERAVEIAEERAEKMAEKIAEERAVKMAEEMAEERVKERLHMERQNRLLELIAKKIAKGKSVVQIAEELEEEEADILPLYCRMREELKQA